VKEILLNIIYILKSMNERISDIEKHNSMEADYRIDTRNILNDIKNKLLDKYKY